MASVNGGVSNISFLSREVRRFLAGICYPAGHVLGVSLDHALGTEALRKVAADRECTFKILQAVEISHQTTVVTEPSSNVWDYLSSRRFHALFFANLEDTTKVQKHFQS